MEKFFLKKIYDHLGDDESRLIFEKRLMYSITGDIRYIVSGINSFGYLQRELTSSKGKLYIFGAGLLGHMIAENFSEFHFEAFIDNATEKTSSSDILPIMSLSEFMKDFQNSIVIIASYFYAPEIKQQLLENGFPEEMIIKGGGNQYFDLPYFIPQKNEFFVDVGGLDGSTTRMFFKWLSESGYEGRSVIFEPNHFQYRDCIRNIKAWNYENVEIINKGLWHKEEMVRFVLNASMSCVSESGGEIIEVVRLDEYLKYEKESVTFIKMDIEGAEYQALVGAEKTIKECKPKLAISVYHNPEDIWKIPCLILDYVPEYRFYIRHYGYNGSETVLYAFI